MYQPHTTTSSPDFLNHDSATKQSDSRPALSFLRDIDSDAVQILYIVFLLQEHNSYGDCVRLGRNEITRVF